MCGIMQFQKCTGRWQQTTIHIIHFPPLLFTSVFLTFLFQQIIPLIFLYDLHGSLGIIEWEQNLI